MLEETPAEVAVEKTSMPAASPASPPRPPLFVGAPPPPAPPRPPVRALISYAVFCLKKKKPVLHPRERVRLLEERRADPEPLGPTGRPPRHRSFDPRIPPRRY